MSKKTSRKKRISKSAYLNKLKVVHSEPQQKMIIAFVLDESGSMSGSQKQTIEGFNNYIKEQQKDDGVLKLVSLVKFADAAKPVFIARPIQDVPELNTDTYKPYGNTALYDAVGTCIQETEEALARETESKTNVLVIIFTDGEENSSKQFCGKNGLSALKEKIQSKEKDGNWSFVFFGQGITAWQAAGGMGVSQAMAVNTSDKHLYKAMSASTSQLSACVLRSGGLSAGIDFFANQDDYRDIQMDASPLLKSSLGPDKEHDND